MTVKSFTNTLNKNAQLFIAIVWLLTTLLYLKLFGVVTNLESEKYIEQAHEFIKNGSFSAPRYWFYSITIFIIVIALKFKIGLAGAFVLQALLNLFAYLRFYKALKQIFQIPITALGVILYLLVFLPYQSWVVFLFTESAFFSLILILFSIVVLYKPRGVKNILLLGTALLLVIMARPLGILFAASAYLYLFYSAEKKSKIGLGFILVALVAFTYYSVNTIFSSITDWSITQAFEQESIICNLPTSTPSYTQLHLAASGNPVYKLLFYITHNFSHFLHFAALKLQYFFLMTRPYYSTVHNYFLSVNTMVIYLLAVAGFFFKQHRFKKGVNAFVLTSILFYTITIILQCDDYHNRFVLSIFPFFAILAARTVELILLSFLKNNQQTSGINVEKPIA
jgi:hypothetical protein